MSSKATTNILGSTSLKPESLSSRLLSVFALTPLQPKSLSFRLLFIFALTPSSLLLDPRVLQKPSTSKPLVSAIPTPMFLGQPAWPPSTTRMARHALGHLSMRLFSRHKERHSLPPSLPPSKRKCQEKEANDPLPGPHQKGSTVSKWILSYIR